MLLVYVQYFSFRTSLSLVFSSLPHFQFSVFVLAVLFTFYLSMFSSLLLHSINFCFCVQLLSLFSSFASLYRDVFQPAIQLYLVHSFLTTCSIDSVLLAMLHNFIRNIILLNRALFGYEFGT
jgi:hypothetical protein